MRNYQANPQLLVSLTGHIQLHREAVDRRLIARRKDDHAAAAAADQEVRQYTRSIRAIRRQP